MRSKLLMTAMHLVGGSLLVAGCGGGGAAEGSGLPAQASEPITAIAGPVLISPVGGGVSALPTYRWNSAPDALSYNLWVNDATGARVKASYPPAEAGCGAGGVCSVTPAIELGPGNGKWWVQAQSEGGPGPWSVPLTFSVPSLPPQAVGLAAPAGVTSTNRPTYVWTAASAAADYYLWANDAFSIRVQQVYTTIEAGCATKTVCSVTPDIALQPGHARFWVQARNALGNSPWSAALAFTVPDTSGAPIPPVLLGPKGEVKANTFATYEWTASPGTTQYYLWVNDSSRVRLQRTFTAEEAGCATSSTCAVTPDGYDTWREGTLRFWVQAQNTFGNSAWSQSQTFKIVECLQGEVDGARYVGIVSMTTFTSFPSPYIELRTLVPLGLLECLPHLARMQICIASSGCFAVGNLTITDPGGVTLGRYDPMPPGISWQPSDTVLLCDGPCSEPSNVVDALRFGDAAPPLPPPLTFNGGPVPQISADWEHQIVYYRAATSGANPNFQVSDWTHGPRFPNYCPEPHDPFWGGAYCDPAESPPICTYPPYQGSPVHARCRFDEIRQDPGESPRWWYSW